MLRILEMKCLEASLRQKSHHAYLRSFFTFFKLKLNCLQRDKPAALAMSYSASVGVKTPPPSINEIVLKGQVFFLHFNIEKFFVCLFLLLKSHNQAFNVKIYRMTGFR